MECKAGLRRKKVFMGRKESLNVNSLIWATLLYRFGHSFGIDAEIYELVYSQLKVPFRGFSRMINKFN